MKKRGRHRKILDPSRITELAAKGYSIMGIAAILGVSDDTLRRNYAVSIKKGHVLRNGELQAKQFECAMAGNARMLIWLGKQWLGQREPRQS